MRSRATRLSAEEQQRLARKLGLTLPENGFIPWNAAYGNNAPIWIEVGTGNGIFLEETAALHPAVNFLGIEREPEFYWKMVRRIDGAELTNVRTLCADAWDVLAAVAPHSVDKLFCLFSDPWPKRRHAKNRVVRAELLPELERILKPGGSFEFRSDVAWYVNLAITTFRERIEIEKQPWQFTQRAPWVSQKASHYEQKGRGIGRQPWAVIAEWNPKEKAL